MGTRREKRMSWRPADRTLEVQLPLSFPGQIVGWGGLSAGEGPTSSSAHQGGGRWTLHLAPWTAATKQNTLLLAVFLRLQPSDSGLPARSHGISLRFLDPSGGATRDVSPELIRIPQFGLAASS